MNESQQVLSNILHEIINNEEEDVKQYYGMVVNSYSDDIIDKYSKRLDDINDRIYLAQWCSNFNKVNSFIESVQLSKYQKQKYELLKQNNFEINETINFKILSEKYSFLDNILDMVVTDMDIQDQILSLSDERLELFKLMYQRLNETTDFLNPYIEKILQRIGYVSLDTAWQNKYHIYDNLLAELDKLVKDGGSLFESEIDTLLYLCTSSIQYSVPSFAQMQKFGQIDTIDQLEFQSLMDEIKDSKDIDKMKFLLLAQIYGIHFEEAKKLCNRYNIQGIKLTEDNKDLFEMYRAIYQIVNEEDFSILLDLYNQFMKQIHPKIDFRRIIVFENEMRRAFAHDLNNRVFKVDNMSYVDYDGIDIYDAGTNFKMIVTAIGAYQTDFTNKEDYNKYWNSPNIRSHGNSCSLIGNSNLSIATVKNIILGFSSMSDSMLLLSGVSDINSTPNSRMFNTTNNSAQRFMSADNLLNNTRGDYNELVYERRDLSSNPKFYKKNPDYVVFIEEYENFDNVLKYFKDNPKKVNYLMRQKEDQERKWKESLKAAKDFGVPIVKINREKIAKSEYFAINGLIEKFQETRDPELLTQIITRFESNRVGNCGIHGPIREAYFSKKNMSNIIEKLKEYINKEENDINKTNLYYSLYKALIDEQERVNACKNKRDNNQTSGINFEKELTEIKQILSGDFKGFRRKI